MNDRIRPAKPNEDLSALIDTGCADNDEPGKYVLDQIFDGKTELEPSMTGSLESVLDFARQIVEDCDGGPIDVHVLPEDESEAHRFVDGQDGYSLTIL